METSQLKTGLDSDAFSQTDVVDSGDNRLKLAEEDRQTSINVFWTPMSDNMERVQTNINYSQLPELARSLSGIQLKNIYLTINKTAHADLKRLDNFFLDIQDCFRIGKNIELDARIEVLPSGNKSRLTRLLDKTATAINETEVIKESLYKMKQEGYNMKQEGIVAQKHEPSFSELDLEVIRLALYEYEAMMRGIEPQPVDNADYVHVPVLPAGATLLLRVARQLIERLGPSRAGSLDAPYAPKEPKSAKNKTTTVRDYCDSIEESNSQNEQVAAAYDGTESADSQSEANGSDNHQQDIGEILDRMSSKLKKDK